MRAPQPSAFPTPSPLPSNVTAVQLEVPSVGINVRVFQPTNAEQCGFPPSDGAICSAGLMPTTSPAVPPAGTQHELVRLRPRPQRPVQAAVERAARGGGARSHVGRLGPPLRRDRGAPERRLPRSPTPTRRSTPRIRRSRSRSTTTCDEATFWTRRHRLRAADPPDVAGLQPQLGRARHHRRPGPLMSDPGADLSAGPGRTRPAPP